MQTKSLIKNTGNILSIISFVIPLINFLLILNWFFQVTPYQKWEGMPLLITPATCGSGLLLGLISLKKLSNKFGLVAVIFNTILIALPFLYMFFGTLIEALLQMNK